MTVNLTEKNKIIAVYGYASTTTGISTTMVDMDIAGQVTFLLLAGTLAQDVTVKAYQSTTSTSGSAMAAKYQKASTGVITLSELDGALTALTAASGVVMTASTDNYKLLAVTIKQQDLTAGYKYVGLVTTSTNGNNYLSVIAVCGDLRFPQAIPPSVQ